MNLIWSLKCQSQMRTHVIINLNGFFTSLFGALQIYKIFIQENCPFLKNVYCFLTTLSQRQTYFKDAVRFFLPSADCRLPSAFCYLVSAGC
jgi:hypothetical protein